MDIISDYLKDPHAGKINLRALLQSRGSLAAKQSQYGPISVEFLRSTFTKTNHQFSDIEVNFHSALMVESSLQPLLGADSTIRLAFRKGMISDEMMFLNSILNTLQVKGGPKFQNSPIIQEFKKCISIFCQSKFSSRDGENVSRTEHNHVDNWESDKLLPTRDRFRHGNQPDRGYTSQSSPYNSGSREYKGELAYSSPSVVVVERVDGKNDNKASDDVRTPLENCEPVVRFLAAVRRQGMDLLFPKSTQDKVLAAVYVAVQMAEKPAHREIIDMVMSIKSNPMFSNLQNISKTKIRGLLALMKHGKMLDAQGAEGEPVKLSIPVGVTAFENLRAQHDKYLRTFSNEFQVPMDNEYWSEIVWSSADVELKKLPSLCNAYVKELKTFFKSYTPHIRASSTENEDTVLAPSQPKLSVVPSNGPPEKYALTQTNLSRPYVAAHKGNGIPKGRTHSRNSSRSSTDSDFEQFHRELEVGAHGNPNQPKSVSPVFFQQQHQQQHRVEHQPHIFSQPGLGRDGRVYRGAVEAPYKHPQQRPNNESLRQGRSFEQPMQLPRIELNTSARAFMPMTYSPPKHNQGRQDSFQEKVNQQVPYRVGLQSNGPAVLSPEMSSSLENDVLVLNHVKPIVSPSSCSLWVPSDNIPADSLFGSNCDPFQYFKTLSDNPSLLRTKTCSPRSMINGLTNSTAGAHYCSLFQENSSWMGSEAPASDPNTITSNEVLGTPPPGFNVPVVESRAQLASIAFQTASNCFSSDSMDTVEQLSNMLPFNDFIDIQSHRGSASHGVNTGAGVISQVYQPTANTSWQQPTIHASNLSLVDPTNDILNCDQLYACMNSDFNIYQQHLFGNTSLGNCISPAKKVKTSTHAFLNLFKDSKFVDLAHLPMAY